MFTCKTRFVLMLRTEAHAKFGCSSALNPVSDRIPAINIYLFESIIN